MNLKGKGSQAKNRYNRELFEDYNDIPDNVQRVLDKYEDAFMDGDYEGLREAKKEVNKIGYTFNFDMDGTAYGLKPLNKMAEGGSIGFIPMDLEEDLIITAKWGGTNVKGVIGILNAMIDSGLTDEELKPEPTKNTLIQIEKAKEKKIKEIWNKIEPNYKGDFKGNMYYSTIERLVERSGTDDNILKRFKPFRKFQKDSYADGGGVANENALMVANNNKQIFHHTKEMAEALKGAKNVPAWVVAKVNRSASDLSDATHYLEGAKGMYADGGEMGQYRMETGGKLIFKPITTPL